MTLIMAWRELMIERVWIVGDSRLSFDAGHGRHVRLTDSAAKVLSVPMVLRRQTPLNVLGTPVLVSNLAFAYAGSSLIALQAYTAILPLWSHLQTVGPEELPSVRACADHLAKFVLAYAKDVSSAHGKFQMCECAIVGYDSIAQTIDGWIVRPKFDGEITVAVQKMRLAPGEIHLFGSGAFRAQSELDALPSREGGLWRREPLQMIRDHLRAEPSLDVGGGVQLGYVNEQGFQLSFDVQPENLGSPVAAMRFRGFEFSEISNVGTAFVNLPGAA